MTVTSKWVALHEVSDYLAKGWREVQIIGGPDDAALMVSPEELASEPAKVECPNCGEMTSENHEVVQSDGLEGGRRLFFYTCQQRISELDDRHNRMASPEYQAKVKADMSRRAVEIGVDRLVGITAFPVGNCPTCGELVAPWNKHAKYEGGYTCKPAPAVAMTEELNAVLEYLEEHCERAESDEGSEQWLKSECHHARACIAAVRSQAAEAGKVRMELPEIRTALGVLRARAICNDDVDALEAALVELDAAEGNVAG